MISAGKLTQIHASYRAARGSALKKQARIFSEEEGVDVVLDRKFCGRPRTDELEFLRW
jgi:hypothetical protein